MKIGDKIAWMLLVLMLGLSAHACVEPDGANGTNYINLATQYSNSLAYLDLELDTSVPGYSTYGYGSGVLLNGSWVLSAAHVITDDSGNVIYSVRGVAIGSHITASSTLYPVLNMYVYPGFDRSGNGPDLLLIQLAAPVNAPSMVISPTSIGDTVTSAGFGQFGTPSTGLQFNDGYARAWQAPVDNANSEIQAYNPSFFQSDTFGSPHFSGLNGRGAPGDSGAPVFSASGQLVGIVEGGTTSLLEVGETYYNEIAQTNEYAWIMNTITPAAAQILSVTPTNADVQLVWSGKGGSNYVVQAASAIGGTNAFSDISGVIALPGVGSVTTNFLDAGAWTNFPARFYRVRTD